MKFPASILGVLIGSLLLFSIGVQGRTRGQEQSANSTTAANQSANFKQMATAAIGDLLTHFWVGDAATGHILDTYNGYARRDDPRGILWERATMLAVLENYCQVTKDPQLRQRIAADWAHIQQQIRPTELQSCGTGSHNVGQDDAGWSALMYMNVYRVTKNVSALASAEGLFVNAYARWSDGALGGGMWYNDKREFKSSYQAALILVGLRLYEATKNRQYWEKALSLYRWTERTLLRPDGLYWCEYREKGPQSVGGIHEGLSVTFLGGNMAMGVIHARLFRITEQAMYKMRALRTADAILVGETDGKGHYLDDRDAYANGYFMGEWAREVLSLPGIKPEHKELLRQTAVAIREQARTPAGYYGGCWNGPAEGESCAWQKAGFKPEQLMTSASAVNVIVAAAQLDGLGL